MRKNDIIELVCQGYGSDGMGVGRYDGMAVFVSGAIAGERCEVRVLKVLKNLAFGKVERVLEPSEARTEPDCKYFPACGGCGLRHMSYDEELRFKKRKVEDALRRIGGADISVDTIHPAAKTERYRDKVQFPVAGGRIGFYRGRSHDVVDVEDCLLQPEAAGDIRRAIKGWMERYGVTSYDEQTQRGLIRHLFVRTSFEGEVLVCLVVNERAGRGLPHEAELADTLRNGVPGLVGLVVNYNRDKTNVILGREYRTVWGREYLEERLCGLDFRLSMPSFFQVNREQCEVLYSRALDMAGLTGEDTVLDLYCGIGTISLCAAKRAKRVYGAEIVPEAVEDARGNAKRNGVENAEFYTGDASDIAERFLRDGVRPDAVIVDPPRRGLTAEVIKAVAQMAPERVIYVSCDCATLARDVKMFADLGYEAKRAEAVDMFPRTSHVETVCLLSKLNVKQHIEVELTMDEMDLTAAEKKASYEEIKEYVLEKFGMKVSHLYIAQVKRKCGIIERENYNKPKSESAKQPQCPPEKEAAIRAALEYFRMI